LATKRRHDGRWLASAIQGDPKRGGGILNNELYIGRYIWNRRRSRKKLKSGDREFLLRPPEEWIATSLSELCIISEDVWQKVKARQRERAAHIGARVRRGLSKHQAYATGAYPKYLLSGLLQCGMCGSNLIVSGPAQGYVCATRVNGGMHACSNRLRLPRIRDEISNLVNAIAHGALQSSPALADRLAQAELKLAAEAGNTVVCEGAAETRTPKSLESYEQFITTISVRFREDSRETRKTLAGLVGGAIRLTKKRDARVGGEVRIEHHHISACTAV
jgi:Recombinase/Recombinase zinc beta ribbon domain